MFGGEKMNKWIYNIILYLGVALISICCGLFFNDLWKSMVAMVAMVVPWNIFMIWVRNKLNQQKEG